MVKKIIVWWPIPSEKLESLKTGNKIEKIRSQFYATHKVQRKNKNATSKSFSFVTLNFQKPSDIRLSQYI